MNRAMITFWAYNKMSIETTVRIYEVNNLTHGEFHLTIKKNINA